MTDIKIAVTDQDIASCWEAMSLLRPMLQKEHFVAQIKAMQQEGYTLLCITDGQKAVSVAGYRIYTMLYCGKLLYIDDLSTLESSRGKGYATTLLQHIYTLAKAQGCQSVQLDSGPSRTTAHKLYFKEDFTISAYHFNKPLQ